VTPRSPRTALVAVLAAVAAGVAGCSSAVDVTPGPDAADPACAKVVASLPRTVAGLSSREVTAQGAAAWGDPPVVLRCGVAPPGPSTDCQHVESPDAPAVDWVVHEPRAGRVRWVTYGRVPAVELSMPADGGVVNAATIQVAAAVAATAQRRACTPE
jgi:hypothetical protein